MKPFDAPSFSETDYQKLTRACDKLISRPDAPHSIVMLPWLHIINEVPFVLAAYSDVLNGAGNHSRHIPQPDKFVSVRNMNRRSAYNFAQFIKCFIRSFYFSDSNRIVKSTATQSFLPSLELPHADVIIVTWLLNRKHLKETTDFYFGELQDRLYRRGLSSLLLMRNQSGYHSHKLQREAFRKGPCARLLLPDTQNPKMELSYLKQGLALRRYLSSAVQRGSTEFEKRIFQKVSELSIILPGVDNFRLHDQIEIICRHFAPSLVVTLYEGHAWERCVWHAARTVNQKTICVGYQHVILRKNSHAIRRSLHPDRSGYDPDLLLTMGEITQKMLERSHRLKNVAKLVYGTHRRIGSRIEVRIPKTIPAFLVLPEGVESESIYLFDMALKCAVSLPDIRFIFRMHPVLQFEKIASKLSGYPAKTGNVDLSDRPNIEEDFERTGYILYRGSSTVMYAILAGMKPYYFERPNEMNFDPIFELPVWRERVHSPEELVRRFEEDRQTSGDYRCRQWKEALNYCDQYAVSVREDALDKMVALSGINGKFL